MDHPNIKVRNTRKYGKAVFATGNIRKGEVISTFNGRIYDHKFDKWTKDLLTHAVQIGRSMWRDSLGSARYINHSCEPNCGIKGLFTVVAMRDIRKGEEITWDYEMTEKSWWFRMKCKCGTEACRKIIGNYSRMPLKVRRKYRGYISHWLIAEEKRKRKYATSGSMKMAR